MAEPKGPRRIRNLSQGLAYSLIFIGILGVINYLANQYNKSFDSTSNKRYTLSDQSAKIAQEATEDINISYWDRPTNFPNARDLFDRYENLNRSRIKIAYNDIDQRRTEAIAAGVTARGQIFVEVGNKREEAKSLTEEEVTGAMVRALKGGDRTVCFTAGYGEGDTENADPAAGYSAVKELTAGDNYQTRVAPLLPTAEIPTECTILVVNGPKRNLLQPAVDAIKGFVENGGRALIMLDPPLKFGSQVDDNEGLTAVLQSWGVTLNKDLVLDLSGVGRLFGMGPEFPVVSTYNEHAIVRELRNTATAFPVTRSVDGAGTDKTEVSTLLQTTDAALSTRDLSSAQVRVESGEEGVRNLAAAGTYKTGTEGSTGRFVVVGTSRWIGNGFLGFAGNRDLYLNMLNWLSADEDLIAIRPKDPEDRRLNMNASQMTFLFYGSVVGLPLLMALAGFSVWWRRR
jgi:ABC-type uncharacterized transport system involved in gliding motility auxiliary subunit